MVRRQQDLLPVWHPTRIHLTGGQLHDVSDPPPLAIVRYKARKNITPQRSLLRNRRFDRALRLGDRVQHLNDAPLKRCRNHRQWQIE